MPSAAPRPCTQAGCGVLVRDGSGRCAQHARLQWAKRADITPRRAGRWLQRERARLFGAEPLCRLCKAAGRTTLAAVRDHIVPLAEGGADEASNTQPLCSACNEAKRVDEAARGQRRFSFPDQYRL